MSDVIFFLLAMLPTLPRNAFESYSFCLEGSEWDVKNDLKRQFVSVSGFEHCRAFKSEALILADEKEFPLFLSC